MLCTGYLQGMFVNSNDKMFSEFSLGQSNRTKPGKKEY